MNTETSGPAITPRTRARARHILDNYYIGPARDDAVLEIWGYTPGEVVDLHVSTTAESWDLEVARDGLSYEIVLEEKGLKGTHQQTPQECSVTGCGWPVVHRFTVPDNWRAGGYLLIFRARRGDDLVEEHHVIFVRRASTERPAPYVLICATGTWAAYNCWGGSNHYDGITGPDGNAFSPVLSMQRPWTGGFCKLPKRAPRAVPDIPQPSDAMVRYPYMEWAYSYGYSKKYASAGWASYERLFAIWAEEQGYDFDIVTQHDLHAVPDLLTPYRCAVFIGHDEYWSAEMRRAVDNYVDHGGKVARFAGNFLWQTRLEDAGQTQVCYKYTALEADPFRDSDPERVTGAWDMAPVKWPGARTFGANGLNGVYAGLGRCVAQGVGGYTIHRPSHWALDGTGLGYGDVLSRDARIFGCEVDGLEVRMDNGLPFPTGADGADTDITIIGMGLATLLEVDAGIWGETQYVGTADAVFRAAAQHGAVTDETLQATARGNGVMIHWQKGRGEVFNAATCEWVMGLVRREKQVMRVTCNVLDRFGQPR